MIACLAVGMGGFLGSVLRYLIGLVPVRENTLFPIKTFLINIIGSFIIGLVVAAAARNKTLNPNLVLFLKVGICGGFTTFSSFALETSDLLKNGNAAVGICYAVLSVVLGLTAVILAQILYHAFCNA